MNSYCAFCYFIVLCINSIMLWPPLSCLHAKFSNNFSVNTLPYRKDLPEWLQSYPVTLIQFLRFLYQQNGDFLPVFLSGDVLGALASTLFPYATSSEPQSLTSPDEDKVGCWGLMFTVCSPLRKLKLLHNFIIAKLRQLTWTWMLFFKRNIHAQLNLWCINETASWK